ncbi:MAG: 5-(carboxyamino)imidazole ribonucleotide synthase [Bacteroidota bacterium]|jgi:5-(carboxyamino)imidazole ribonucleotide synthase
MIKKIGILGGGQLGRMFLQEARSFPFSFYVLDPDPDAPAAVLADGFTCGSFRDYEQVMQFGKNVDILTIEIEDVNTRALFDLRDRGIKVFPEPEVIELIKDKGRQKEFLKHHALPCGDFFLADTAAQIADQPFGWPVFIKSRTGGYDGKGVQQLNNSADPVSIPGPWLVERKVKVQKELAVIVSRNSKGETAVFPPVESSFHGELHLVDYLISPAEIPLALAEKAAQLALQAAQALAITGLLAVEFFLDENNALYVNEMAPRPHNSGHASIEANACSQFMLWLFAITGLPPASTISRMPAVMINLIGCEGHEGEAMLIGMDEIVAANGAYLHWYGKKITKPGRKMGHVTVLRENMQDAVFQAMRLRSLIKVMCVNNI